MNILFENSHIRTRELAKEIYWYICFKRPFNVIFNVFFGLLFVAIIAISLITEQYNYNSTIILVPLFILFQFYVYFKSVNNMMKRDYEISGDNPLREEMFATDEFIRNTVSTGSVYEIPYSKIKKVVKTKNLILLLSKANLIYIFRKDSFAKGTPAEFLAFLREKGFRC